MKKVRFNNQITAPELRVIDADGGNLGIISLAEALKRAKDLGLDLIEISPSAVPPVAKIMDYGKYQYEEQKKARRGGAPRPRVTEIRGVRVAIGTSEHDLQMKARKASEFLREGHRVKLDLFLRGREKYLDQGFLTERLNRILKFIPEEYRVAQEAKKGPRGVSIIIEKK